MAQDERDQEDGDNRGHHQLHDRLDDGGGAPITVDSLDLRNYVNAYHNADGTFTALQIEQVTGFELNGTAVDVPGFGTQFGLYFLLDGTGHMEGAGQTFDTLRIALMVDPGNNDGALSSTALGGVGFANGTAGDFALATGTLVSATVTFGADGSAHPNFLEQIDPTRIGAKIFGDSLDAGALLNLVLTTPGGPQTVQLPGGDFIQFVDGWGTGTAELSPQAPITLGPGAPGHDQDSHHGVSLASICHY